MTILEWFLIAMVVALGATLYWQRSSFSEKMRHLHRNISYSAQVIEMEVGSVNMGRTALGVAAKLLRASTHTTRPFLSDKTPEFSVSPMVSEFARNAIVGTVVPIDCRIVEPCDWDSGIVRAVIELPAKMHERDACIMSLELDQFQHNPVVLDHADFGQSLPLGQADAELEEDGVSLEIGLAIGVNDRAAQMRDELKVGRFSLCAYVRVSGVMTVLEAGVLHEEGLRGSLLCNGELVAIQPYLTNAEQTRSGGESK